PPAGMLRRETSTTNARVARRTTPWPYVRAVRAQRARVASCCRRVETVPSSASGEETRAGARRQDALRASSGEPPGSPEPPPPVRFADGRLRRRKLGPKLNRHTRPQWT